MPSLPVKLSSLLPVVALIAILPWMTGCSAFSPTAGPANSFVTAGTMSGHVHGGNQPVVGATISLYAVGTSGYGSGATLYAQTTSADDQYGSFSFTQTTGTSPTGPPSSITSTYACPTGSLTNPDPQMYLIASGGETQGVGNGINSASAFILALGKCSTVASLYVDMNEITSVATMAALQQYFNPVTESFGYPDTTQATLGFADGVAAIANLANISSGAAQSSTTYSAQPAGSTNTVTVTVTPEVNQINLIANILAACVNNTSNTATGCTTLFSDAVPPSASVTSQPSTDYSSITASNEDTVQALYFMLTDPDSGGVAGNMSGLYNLAVPQAPFQPYYSSAPTDWTIAVSYSSTNSCTLSAGNGTTSAQNFLAGVNDPAVDAQGNVWADAVGGTGGLFEISSTGTPLACGLGSDIASPVPVVLDVNSNAWVGSATSENSSYNLYKWSGDSGDLESTWPTSGTYKPTAVTADGNGNTFYADTNGGLSEFLAAATDGATVTSPVAVAAFGSSADILFMQADSSGNLWVPNTIQAKPADMFEVFPSTNTSGSTYLNGFETGTISTDDLYSPYGIGIGNGTIYSSNGAGSGSSGTSYRWDIITPGGTPGTATVANTAVNVAGNDAARGVAVDGASNVWQCNNNAATGNWVTGATSSGLFSVSEISSTGTALSATSATGTGAYGDNTGSFQKPAAFLKYGARGVAIDPTGNVWVGQNSSSASNIIELVGAAVPAVTPLSLAAQTGKLGQTP